MPINLWDFDELCRGLKSLYGFSGEQLFKIIYRICNEPNCDYVEVFCEETGVQLDEVNIAEDLVLVGKIVSTTVDDFYHLKQVGILPLDVLLETDSPISRHLKKYQIDIRPKSHELFHKGKKYYIPTSEWDCKWCAYGDAQCRYEKERYRDMCCPYLEAIKNLSSKLYVNKSEIEMFLISSESEMMSYSSVKYYPEIFDTVEVFIEDWLEERLTIGLDWMKEKQSTCIITVPVRFVDTTFQTGYVNVGSEDAEDIFEKYAKYCKIRYNDYNKVPKSFWDNIWLIKVCMEVISSFGDYCGEKFIAINHNVIFSPSSMSIDKIKID